MEQIRKELEDIIKSTLVIENKKGIPFCIDKLVKWLEKQQQNGINSSVNKSEV